MTPLRRVKRSEKINRIAPKERIKKRYDTSADIFFRNEHPDKPERPEPKVKGRVLTSIEKEFWSGLTS